MSDPPTFKRLRNADIATIYDDTGQTYWWMLRSMPAINYLGFQTFTYPTSWRSLNTGGEFPSYTHQYDYLDYDYKVLGQLEEDAFRNNLVLVTTEYYEAETEYSIDHLVSRYAGRPETLIVVTDSRRFTPRGGQRPLYQEQFVESIGSFDRLYAAHEEVYENAGWELPLLNTKNLFLHDNANLYEFVTGEELEDTQALFEVLPDAPFLPLYDVFGQIFARPDEYGSVPLDEDDVTGLERWLRRRVEWERDTASTVARNLNRAVSDDGQTFDPSYAERTPIVKDAADRAAAIEPNESSIHKRYHAWLQRNNR